MMQCRRSGNRSLNLSSCRRMSHSNPAEAHADKQLTATVICTDSGTAGALMGFACVARPQRGSATLAHARAYALRAERHIRTRLLLHCSAARACSRRCIRLATRPGLRKGPGAEDCAEGNGRSRDRTPSQRRARRLLQSFAFCILCF